MDPAYEYHNTIFYPSLKSTALQSIQCTHIHSTFTAQSNGNKCKMYNCINSMRDRSYILYIPKLSGDRKYKIFFYLIGDTKSIWKNSLGDKSYILYIPYYLFM